MKKWIFFLSIFVLLLTGCGNASTQNDQKDMILVYYINKAETKIAPMEYDLKGDSVEEEIRRVLEALQETPVEMSLRTVTTGFEVNEFSLEEGLLTLDVTSDYSRLATSTEVLVRAALVRTLTQIEGVSYVAMTVEQEALKDALGIIVGPMTSEMFIDNAGNEFNAYEKTQLKLYFANEDGNGLVESSVEKVYNSNISKEKLVVEALIAGPGQESRLSPVLNPDTKVLGVSVKDGTCYVNLDDGFLTQLYNVTADVTIFSIVNSLAELSNINKVQIAVNGETKLTYRETFALSEIYERNLDLVYHTKNE